MVGDFDWPDDLVDLLEVLELWGEAAVHADNLFVDDGADRHHVEAVREDFPQFEVVPAFA